MTEFKKNMARYKKLEDFLVSQGFEISAGGLVYKRGEVLQSSKWHVAQISREYIRNIDLLLPLYRSDFPWMDLVKNELTENVRG